MMRVIRFGWGARVVSLCVAAALALAGCTSMHRVPLVSPVQAPAQWPVKQGDDVRVTLRDGRVAEFTVGAVKADAIIAHDDGARYEGADIVTLERRQFSGRRTALLLLGIPVGAFLLGMLAFAVEGK